MKMKDLPEALVKDFENNFPDMWIGGGIAAGKLYRNNGNLVTTHNGAACHIWVPNVLEDGFVINCATKHRSALNDEFVQWVCNGTPFSHGVVNRHEESIITKGQIIDVSAVGRGGALWLCKAIRLCVEENWRLKRWKELKDAGVKPFLAFVLTSSFDSTGKANLTTTHPTLFLLSRDEKCFRKMMDEVLKGDRKEPISQGLIGVFDKSFSRKDWDNVTVGRWLSLDKKTVRVPDGWGGFIEKKVSITSDEFMKQIEPFNVA